MKIKNLIFDIGRVLVDFDWETYLHSFGWEKGKEEVIADAVFRSTVWQEYDRGVWSLEQLIDSFTAYAPQYRAEIETVFLNSERCIRGRAYARPWLQELKARGFRVYYLSNYSERMKKRTMDALNFLDVMDGGLFSYEAGLIKPDPAIFEEFLRRFPEVIPEESVFWDDTPANVEAACSCGLHGLLFEEPGKAEHALEQLRPEQ